MPTMQEVKFKRKTTNEIEQLEIEDGSLIYNVENGKTYMDYGNDRIPTGGGANGGIYVGEDEPTDPDITLWVNTPASETKASEIVNEYTESDKVGYSCEYINELVNRQKYVVESDTTSIDIPINIGLGEFLKITMIQSGTATEHEQPLYIKPNNLSSFSYRTVRTTGSTNVGSETTAKTKIIDGNNRIVVGHLDSVMTFITMIFFVGNGNKFNYYTNSAIASSNSVNQFTQNGYIGSAYFNSNKIENITIFTDSSTVKIPAGTTFIVEKF